MGQKLKDRVAIVTGAGTGIGKAIAHALASEGADIVGAARRVDKLRETAQEVQQLDRNFLVLNCDVSIKDDCNNVVTAALSEFGRIDILVNNASIYPVTKFLDITSEEWNDVLAINLNGPFYMSQAVLPHMIERRCGKIIMINSSQIRRSPITTWHVHYVAAKMGILGLTRCLAAEFGPMGIQVNGIAPGYTPDTEQAVKHVSPVMNSIPGLNEQNIKNIPLRRYAQTGDYEGPAVFLASDDSDYITGQTISVDGGITMQG